MAAFSPTMAMNMVVHPLQRHIKEIKRRLLVVGATIMVFFVVAFSYSGLLIEWFKRPFEDDLIFLRPCRSTLCLDQNLLFSGDRRQCAHDPLSVLEIYFFMMNQVKGGYPW